LTRYPQFYSRIGFVHEFRPLGISEIRQLLGQRWTPPGVHLPQQPLDPETVAAIIRITGGNFRLLNRLLTQMERILEINALEEVTRPSWRLRERPWSLGRPKAHGPPQQKRSLSGTTKWDDGSIYLQPLSAVPKPTCCETKRASLQNPHSRK